MTETDRLLALVRQALDDIDTVPLPATARRTARLASLLGDSVLAVRLGLELKHAGGHPPANAEETRRLMGDPSLWGEATGPAEEALRIYFAEREIPAGQDNTGLLAAHSLEQIDRSLDRIKNDPELRESERFWPIIDHQQSIKVSVQHACFTALCAWERQLTYANTNERIFERFRADVDGLLAAGAPALLDQFNAVHRRLRDAASNPSEPVGEELAQATTSCRRILKAVADHVLPGVHGAESEDGHSLDDQAYRNRVHQFVKDLSGGSAAEAVEASFGGLVERFSAMDQLASKGVHADVGLAEAELCAINTYVVAGELLRLART